MPENNYNETYLKSVIARLDFPSAITELYDQIPKSLYKLALNSFPIPEPQEYIREEVHVQSKGVNTLKTSKEKEYNFYSNDRKRRLAISSNYFFIDFKNYTSFEDLKEIFLNLVNLLFEIFPEILVSRFGVRYVNNIEIKEDDLDWSKYLNKKLLDFIQIPEPPHYLLRSLNKLVLRNNETILNFHYGIHNSNFPSKPTSNNFVLDFDAYEKGVIELSDINSKIEEFHSLIQFYFEDSITDDLRQLMGMPND